MHARAGGAKAVSDTTQAAPSRAWAWLGLRLVETGEGTAVVEMTTTEDMANHSGFVHGGMIRTAVAECSVAGQDGRLVATASATFAVTREKE